MNKRIIIKKFKLNGGYRYLLECNCCHTRFELAGFIFNAGQGQFCSPKCSYDSKRGKPRKLKVTWGDKISKANKGKMLGDKHWNWKGGRRFNNGYIIIYSPQHPYPNVGKYVYEHRLIMEKKIGRYLTNKERIHHINGIITDNRIENLILLSKSGHMKLHNKNRQRNHLGQFIS